MRIYTTCHTIEKPFDRLESAAESGAEEQGYQFHAVGGYPVSAFTDYCLRPRG